jgi:hypothetical protein
MVAAGTHDDDRLALIERTDHADAFVLGEALRQSRGEIVTQLLKGYRRHATASA